MKPERIGGGERIIASSNAPRPPIENPDELLSHLRRDPLERVIRTHTPNGSEWHLERDRRQVAGDLIDLFRAGGALLARFGGRLAPVADGLFPGAAMAQTYIWRPDDTTSH